MSNNNKNNIRPALAILAVLAISACASQPKSALNSDSIAQEQVGYEPISSIHYTVQRNDRLGDIAQEFTGNANTWRAIAKHNNIRDPKLLKVGAVIEIPGELLRKQHKATKTLLSPAQTSQNSNVNMSANTSLAVQQANTQSSAEVIVTPVKINRDFQLNPLEIEKRESVSSRSANSGYERYIKVVGSYYPKGIYAKPAAHSKLLLRVAPGSKFVLDQQVNEWFKISTDTGTGYIRMSDAELM